MEDSNAKDCRIIQTLVDRCTVSPTSPAPLKRLPRQIREQIFGNVIEWHGKTPPLIAALRGDPTLYQEALAILYKKGKFKIHLVNMESRASAYPSTFKYIQKLEIESLNFPGVFFPEELCACTMIRELKASFSVQRSSIFRRVSMNSRFSKISQIWTERLRTVENLSLFFYAGYLWLLGGEDIYGLNLDMRKAVRQANASLRIQAIREGDLWHNDSATEKYTWNATNGKVLKWED